jgi:hypothetical protein
MTINNEQDKLPIRAALITMPPDEPSNIVDLSLMLYHQTEFKLTIVGYKPQSLFSLHSRDPITGMIMPGFAADKFIKYGRSKTQLHCRLIWESLEDILYRDDKLQISYISGRPNKVANSLESVIELFIIPRSFRAPSITRPMFADIDLQLLRAEKIPVLFCGAPKKWKRVIIIEAKEDKDYGDIPVMNYLLKCLGEGILKDKPQEMATIALHTDSSATRPPALASYGILDASSVPCEKQADTVLVVSSRIAGSTIRYRSLKRILQNWSGSVLVFPS